MLKTHSIGDFGEMSGLQWLQGCEHYCFTQNYTLCGYNNWLVKDGGKLPPCGDMLWQSEAYNQVLYIFITTACIGHNGPCKEPVAFNTVVNLHIGLTSNGECVCVCVGGGGKGVIDFKSMKY